MATIYDLIEVTGLFENTTYSLADGNILGVVDGMTGTSLDDGEFDLGDTVQIGGVSYSINVIQEPENASRFTLGDGTDQSVDPGSESNLDAVFMTVSNGTETRHFIIPNDRYGDMNLFQIRTGALEDVAGGDSAIISTTDDAVQIVCFVSGTQIDTPHGRTRIEALQIGDTVKTRDNGAMPVRAIVTQTVDFKTAPDSLKPVRFDTGSLGSGTPDTPLCVSPQHRMLVSDATGAHVLVPAKALLHKKGVRMMHGKRCVTYHHLLFDQHEIIRANGTWTESLLPAPMAIRALSTLPATAKQGAFSMRQPQTAAAPILRVREARRRMTAGA